ncbi:M48 family metallopeptidase [Sedimenticola sp.]|uniref:M48 family metallopeptidase n=1 Tax=Sedimenticola sp. TaxID=1940285 RepID=UPI003D14BB36
MKFEHREIPEGINVTKVHPLRELAVLLGGALLLIALLLYVLGLSAGFLAQYIPFEMEQKLTASFPVDEPRYTEIDNYLARIKAEVVTAMELPEGMEITLHYSSDDTVNAFATLGGHVVAFRGLLEKLPNENALAMLLAHEIAHVKHRDPIVSVSRGLTISTVLTLVLGQSDLDVLGNTGLYTMLHFSREMEQAADIEALEAVYKIYGHTQGADDLFRVIQAYHKKLGEKDSFEFLQSHPLDLKRINVIDSYAESNHWKSNGEPIPIPPKFFKAMNKSVQHVDKSS